MHEQETAGVDRAPEPAPRRPRRYVLRSLASALTGAVALAVLAACGGEDNGDDEDD